MPRLFAALAGLVLLTVPAAAADPPGPKPATADDIKQLIDELAKITDADAGYSPTMSGDTFLPLGWRQFGSGMLFQKPSVQSDTMLRLVRIGAPAVPHLVAHLGDQRPTGIVIDIRGSLGSMDFDNEYDFNSRTTPRPKDLPEKDVNAEQADVFTLKVGDLCFVALGQIVNRSFNAVRYQPTACVILSSPTHSGKFRKIIADEWGKLTPEAHRASLLRDLAEPDWSERTERASLRLAFYYPDSFEAAALKFLGQPYYREPETYEFIREKLYRAKTRQARRNLLDAFVLIHGEVARDGVRGNLFWHLRRQEEDEKDRSSPPDDPEYPARECLIDLFGLPKTVKSTDRPKDPPPDSYAVAGFLKTLVYDRSEKLDAAVRALFVKTVDRVVEDGCVPRLIGRGFDADIEAYLKRRLPAAKEDYERKHLREIEAKLGWTRLHQAVDLGVVELVERELKANVPVNAQARNGRTALHLAAAQGKEDVVESLLAAKADVGLKDKEGRLAVQLAAYEDYTDLVRKLVEKGSAVPDVFVAAVVGKADRLAALLKEDAGRANARNADGLTPLHVAAREGHVEAVRILLDAGAKVDETDDPPARDGYWGRSEGSTALHRAAMAGKVSVAELLLDRGAEVNVADTYGKLTPLHYAAWNGNVALVQLLVGRNADRTAKDERNRTPLDLAKERKHAAVVKVLEP